MFRGRRWSPDTQEILMRQNNWIKVAAMIHVRVVVDRALLAQLRRSTKLRSLTAFFQCFSQSELRSCKSAATSKIEKRWLSLLTSLTVSKKRYSCSTVWFRKFPLRFSAWHLFQNAWEFLVQILHAYYMFLSTLDYNFFYSIICNFDEVMPKLCRYVNEVKRFNMP